jgi:hypothetical protein
MTAVGQMWPGGAGPQGPPGPEGPPYAGTESWFSVWRDETDGPLDNPTQTAVAWNPSQVRVAGSDISLDSEDFTTLHIATAGLYVASITAMAAPATPGPLLFAFVFTSWGVGYWNEGWGTAGTHVAVNGNPHTVTLPPAHYDVGPFQIKAQFPVVGGGTLGGAHLYIARVDTGAHLIGNVFSGTGPPPTDVPGAVTGDNYVDTSTGDFYTLEA